jgi:hypothetical protein
LGGSRPALRRPPRSLSRGCHGQTRRLCHGSDHQKMRVRVNTNQHPQFRRTPRSVRKPAIAATPTPERHRRRAYKEAVSSAAGRNVRARSPDEAIANDAKQCIMNRTCWWRLSGIVTGTTVSRQRFGSFSAAIRAMDSAVTCRSSLEESTGRFDARPHDHSRSRGASVDRSRATARRAEPARWDESRGSARPRSARSARRPTYQGTPADYPGPPMPSYPITSASERGTQVFVSRYL